MGRVWPAMLLGPVLVLVEQTLAYALVTPSCARQAGALLHVVALAFIAAATALTWRAVAEARRLSMAHRDSGDAPPPDTDRHAPQRLLLAQVAAGIGALSVLVLFALWIPQWGLSPCIS